MKAKTWIKIKRGILDPKHREALGVRIWLFLYMLDIVDWKTGVIENWKDHVAAEEMGMPTRTMRTQRRELETAGYISSKQGMWALTITIHNWTNPREYSGDIYNVKELRVTESGHPDSPRVTKSGHHMAAENRSPFIFNSHLKESQYESLKNDPFYRALDEFMEHRRQIKKPVTELAFKKLCKKLSGYSTETAIAMLEQSIENGWQGVFPLKDRGSAASKATVTMNPDGSMYV